MLFMVYGFVRQLKTWGGATTNFGAVSNFGMPLLQIPRITGAVAVLGLIVAMRASRSKWAKLVVASLACKPPACLHFWLICRRFDEHQLHVANSNLILRSADAVGFAYLKSITGMGFLIAVLKKGRWNQWWISAPVLKPHVDGNLTASNFFLGEVSALITSHGRVGLCEPSRIPNSGPWKGTRRSAKMI